MFRKKLSIPEIGRVYIHVGYDEKDPFKDEEKRKYHQVPEMQALRRHFQGEVNDQKLQNKKGDIPWMEELWKGRKCY